MQLTAQERHSCIYNTEHNVAHTRIPRTWANDPYTDNQCDNVPYNDTQEEE